MYAFNPSAPASPGFAAVAGPFQNYQGVYRDASGLYVGGLYSGFTHGIRYVSLDGAVDKVIIENVSTYSAGMARDAAGNLYVGDNDNGGVYRFDVSELAAAISGSALTMADGDLVHDFGDGGHIGSLALDGDGNLWAAGWQQPGLAVYSPRLDLGFEFMPGLSNNNYYVGAFTRDGEDYVAFVNQEDPSRPGSRMIYGYEAVSALVVPEPAAAGLLLLGFAGRGRRRRGM